MLVTWVAEWEVYSPVDGARGNFEHESLMRFFRRACESRRSVKNSECNEPSHLGGLKIEKRVKCSVTTTITIGITKWVTIWTPILKTRR